jgi:hypothetical protein
MEAKALQESLRSFGDALGQAINEIWQQSPASTGGPTSLEENRIVAPATVDRPVVGELYQVLCLASKINS